VKYEWDYNGDGKYDFVSADSGIATTSYKKEGTYKAVLKVHSSNGGIDSVLVWVIISNKGPKAIAEKEIRAAVNKPVDFTGKGESPDSKIVKYGWDFDGNGKMDFGSDTTGKAVYTYKKAGTYHAIFKVKSEDGKTDSVAVSVIVGNSPPVAMAGEDIVSQKGKNIKLIGKGEDSDGNIVKYEWDFDANGQFDYASAKNGEVKHKFEKYGIAVLRVTDGDGAFTVDTTRIIICPKGMATIKEKKYCVDQYEWPNKEGQIPQSNISFVDAAKKCDEAGKHLCTEEEWVYACQTENQHNFPYGYEYNADACNTKDQKWIKKNEVAKSGDFPNCKTIQEVFDMSGNVMEWTNSGIENKKYARGGSYENAADGADCTAKISLEPGKGYFHTGFRCCK
jgi:VCBS repeat-containing protein